MSRSGWIFSAFFSIALLASAVPARASLMSYSFHASYDRVHLTPGGSASAPDLLPGVPDAWQQGDATGVFSFNTDAAPTGQSRGPDSPLYGNAYAASIATSAGLIASATADILLHAPSVIGTDNGHVVSSVVPIPGWSVVGVPLRWEQALAPVIPSDDLHDLPVFTTADFPSVSPPSWVGPVAGDIGIVLNGPDSTQAWLFYRIDSLTYLGAEPVPEPATIVLVASGLLGLGWARRWHR
jgi:hypothetical protein